MTESNTEHLEAGHDEADDAVIGRALRGSLLVFLVLGAIGAAIAFALTRPDEVGPDQVTKVDLPEVRETTVASAPKVKFTDITAASGIKFVHTCGATGEKMLPETMGGGCAFLDYDNDGDQDLLFINSCHWPWNELPADGQPNSVLYQNDGQGNFADVTAATGLEFSSYGMGVAVGDYDNDGWTDVFVTSVGVNRLFRNQDGRFEDVTETAGVAGDDATWSSSAAMIDIDNDGDLDLFVCNYVNWNRDVDVAQDFQLTGVGRAYGPPTSFGGSHPYLYRNDGDGTFTDISANSGVQQENQSTGVPLAKSLGVAPVDLSLIHI